MNRPKVSVVIGVYNGGAELSSSLKSILDEKDIDLECIVVNDGSTDDTEQRLQQFSALDPRIRLITQQNAGLTKALIRGCSEAKGEFIARQDADDLSVSPRLRLQCEALNQDPSLAFVSCLTEYMGPRDEPLFVEPRPEDKVEATDMLSYRRGGPVHGSVMFRRKAYEEVGGYRPELYFAQDHDLWFRLARVGFLNYLPNVLYRYRVSPSSISGRLHPLKIAFANIVDQLDEARGAGLDETALLARAAELRRQPAKSGVQAKTSEAATNYFIARCLAARRDQRSLDYVIDALKDDPLMARAWALLPWSGLLKARSVIL